MLAVMEYLIAHLTTFPENGRFQSYTYQRIDGSDNNILYRTTSEKHNLAFKFTIRDARHRARREFQALSALTRCGLDIAPQPLFLDEESYAQPVVVQTWLEGKVTAVPPQTNAEWQQLISHYATLATISPDKVNIPLETAVVNFANPQDGLDCIQRHLARIPESHRPDILTNLLSKLPACLPSNFQTSTPIALCRVDGNTLNFIRRPSVWASVDWENSGWGDPAFEIADMMTHPKFMEIPEERWQWVMAMYEEMTGDETDVIRIKTYYPLMLVWWVARFARGLYEIPRGLDERLVTRDVGWQLSTQEKMIRYANLAQKMLTRSFI
jgi:aminoglycoside phosphotransferase (APT) family kinase protein